MFSLLAFCPWGVKKGDGLMSPEEDQT